MQIRQQAENSGFILKVVNDIMAAIFNNSYIYSELIGHILCWKMCNIIPIVLSRWLSSLWARDVALYT